MNQTPSAPQLGWSINYVADVAASLDLYRSAFGLDVSFEHPSGDYAEFGTGSTALALCSIETASETTGADLADRRAPTGNITLVVDDVEAAFTHAVANGAKPRVEPATKPWGQTSSYVADLDGNLIEIASPVPR